MIKEARLTVEQANQWFGAFSAKCSARTVPAEGEATAVESFSVVPTPEGMMVRATLRNGEAANLFLNAIVCRALAQAVKICGQDGGWMDADGEIIVEGPEGSTRWYLKE